MVFTPLKNFFILLFCSFSVSLFSQYESGLVYQNKESLQGYVLFAPLYSKTTYLIDKCGRQVHNWQSNYPPGQSVYLLENGDLLRTANDSNRAFRSGGGTIERFTWDNKRVWSYKLSTPAVCMHHDICPLPNGNVLVLVWEKKTKQEAILSGRDTTHVVKEAWCEKIMELKPVGTQDASIVWEWSVWDHLIQDYDTNKKNFGKVSANPQLLDINYFTFNDPDWFHFNSIDYNPQLDQILISNRNYSEVFILDHSTTTQEAAGHNGGIYGKGGDLLFRYGNPRAWEKGSKTEQDQVFFAQHNAHWIKPGLKDAGKILLFNNGFGRKNVSMSSIDMIEPVMNATKQYQLTKTKMTRLYSEKESSQKGGTFFSHNVSSVQRLQNGNLMVCSGSTGRFCELNGKSEVVWLYMNPVSMRGILKRNEIPEMNNVFRCTFFEPGYKGFKGRPLEAKIQIEGPHPGDCYFTGIYKITGR